MVLVSSRENEPSGEIPIHSPFHQLRVFSVHLDGLHLMHSYREFRDYVQWLKGNYVPTEAKLRSMVESGFVFPETCKAILKPMEVNNAFIVY